MEKKQKKGKRVKIDNNGEPVLPEPVIHHIQSFLAGKDAARTSCLSKLWYGAWLTRPTLDFDQSHFQIRDDQLPRINFTTFARRSMRRYRNLNLKIDCFRIRTINYRKDVELGANKLIVKAVKMGATDLDLHLRSVALPLPQPVLNSETLHRLSVSGRRLIGGFNVNCSRLKTLNLGRVHIESDDAFRGIISSCISIEELSLSHCRSQDSRRDKMFRLSAVNLPQHRNLRRLSLECVEVDPLFFSDSDSRFPCLKALSMAICFGHKSIQIHSTSLETMSFVQVQALTAEFDVPNLATLRYSGGGIPSFSVQSSREWELYISLPRIRGIPSKSWFPKVKKAFTKMTPSPSKIFLDIKSSFCTRGIDELVEDDCIHQGVGKPLDLEDLMLESYSMDVILVGLLAFCRPKFITLYWLCENVSLDWVCKRLMKESITANRCIPDQNVFGEIGLKEVDVQLYEEILTEWRPLPLLLKEPLDFSIVPEKKRRIRFQLRWG